MWTTDFILNTGLVVQWCMDFMLTSSTTIIQIVACEGNCSVFSANKLKQLNSVLLTDDDHNSLATSNLELQIDHACTVQCTSLYIIHLVSMQTDRWLASNSLCSQYPSLPISQQAVWRRSR